MKNILAFLFLLMMPFFYSCSSDENQNDVYIINNKDFGISSNKTNALATTEGINTAIAKAKTEGFLKVKLTAGEYLIQCADNSRWARPSGGIFVPSDIVLDLTGAKIYLEANDDEHYGLIQIDHVKNVTIIGGHLIGDRHQHTYVGGKSHEYGFGVNIYSSENVILKDITIEGMTGDAVFLGDYGFASADKETLCKRIRITGCELFDCRRQGISVIHADDVEIDYNAIYNIWGTNPQFGIDIEPEVDYGRWVKNVSIHHNAISDCKGGISFHGGTDMEAYENQLDSVCLIAVFSQRVRIYKNTVTAYIYAGEGSAQRPCWDICIPTTGNSKNNCKAITNKSIQTGNFLCE